LFNVPTFLNSIFFEIMLLMNLSFSPTLNSSFPHIEQNGTRFKTPTNNFAHLVPSFFHNLMARPSLKFHKTSIGDTLYCITSHPILSTKNWNKCIFIWPTRTSKPSFKYPLTQDLKSRISRRVVKWMDNLGKTWMISSNLPWHNYFALSNFLTNIQKFCQYLHVCAQL